MCCWCAAVVVLLVLPGVLIPAAHPARSQHPRPSPLAHAHLGPDGRADGVGGGVTQRGGRPWGAACLAAPRRPNKNNGPLSRLGITNCAATNKPKMAVLTKGL